jgi:hypothetical protein
MIKDRPPRLDEIFQTYDLPLFFVTICTIHRQKIADLGKVHRSFQQYIARAHNEFGIVVGRYVLMPIVCISWFEVVRSSNLRDG